MTTRRPAPEAGTLLLLLAERGALELAESSGVRPPRTVARWMESLSTADAEQVAAFDRLVKAKLLILEKTT